jgi:hypothetical protein
MAERTKNMIRSYCNWESRRPFTHNTEYFQVFRPKILFHLAQTRYKKPAAPPSNTFQLTDPPLAFTNLNEDFIVNDDDGAVTGAALDDQYASELEIAAEIATYYRVAVKRAFDIVPMCIENEFLVSFGVELRNNLENMLGLIGDSGTDTCGRYAVENLDVQEKRAKLVKIKERLNMAIQIVNEI